MITGLAPTAELVTEEVFGPVLAVQTFDDDAEAIAMANDTVYGLAASVWTNNLRRAHTVAAALRAGTVSVNTVDALSAQTPVRRLQAVRLRTRPVAACARQVHRPQDHLDPVLR